LLKLLQFKREHIPDTALLQVQPCGSVSVISGRRKRMKFRKFGQIVLASVVSLGLAAGITACTSRTIDFVYVISATNPGQINVYESDSKSGALRQLSVSPYKEQYSTPSAILVSPDDEFLYVAYQGSNVIVQYAVGSNGSLAAANAYSTPGSSPVALAMNEAGTYVYAAETYQPGFGPSNPGTGGALIVYPRNSADGTLGTPLANPNIQTGNNQFYAVGANPSSVAVLANNNAIFVAERNDPTLGAGSVHAFVVGSGGALTPMGAGNSGLGAGVYAAGVQPTSVIGDLTSTYVYVTDYKQNQLLGYTVQSGNSLVPMPNSPFKTGNQPTSVTIDPRNKYLYVTNFTDATLSGFALDSVTGNLTALAGGLTAASTDPEPTCVFVEPALARFVYTTNFLGNTVSGFLLNPNTGALTSTQGSPVPAAAQPICGVAIVHGNHAIQHVDTQ
jgi:6-phosphogluconolactonase